MINTPVLEEHRLPETEIEWCPGSLVLVFAASVTRPVVLSSVGCESRAALTAATQPLVELMVTGDGRARNTTRFTNTGVGSRLRYVEHAISRGADDGERLDIVQSDPVTGLRVTTKFEASGNIPAARIRTSVVNEGGEPQVIEIISSFATGAVVYPGEVTTDLDLYSGTGEQLAENRWSVRRLWSQSGLADVNSVSMGQQGRGGMAAIGTSTWSTARALPTGALQNARTGRSIAWQIEHNGGWRWELDNVGHGEDSVALVLMGPEDLDHHWAHRLDPGDRFTSVPVSIAVADSGFEDAIAALTRHRRWLRREQAADRGWLLVFNDYMNTLNGNPTTERLLPLIEAARQAGAEAFCIDAGWYDDTDLEDWWPTVGEWIPSVRRFPDGGLGRVVTAIHDAGMRPGLWLEPEVVGVLSPVAQVLPDAAFLQRHGRRVTEHDRFFLDLRHPAGREHLDVTFDRLVSEFGIGYFKLDYNVTPGPGTDQAFSVGAGLLDHNRAHLAWFADLRRRHPLVVFENCSSGAMRADFAMLELFDLQSTSDQEDFRLYPAIAAGAPVQMLPEQAGNWAYPQSWMTDEEIGYTMVTGLSGRLYLSGFLDAMSVEQLELVRSATALFKQTRDSIADAVARWPLGLPEWSADAFALQLDSANSTLLYLWHRGGESDEIGVRFRRDVQAEDLVELYPNRLQPWRVDSAGDGRLVFHPGVLGPSARVYKLPRP